MIINKGFIIDIKREFDKFKEEKESEEEKEKESEEEL